jgi:DNA processing protein
MARRCVISDVAEREAVVGLWAVPGIGPVALGCIARAVGGALRSVADVPVREWLHLVDLPDVPREWLSSVTTLRELAGLVRDRAAESRMQIHFAGDEGYPERLLDIADPPPLIFSLGRIGKERRRVAVVGSRHPDHGVEPKVAALVSELARAGLCVISGAAIGLDRTAHLAALEVGGETWAFIASGLDELDPAQRLLAREILNGGGRILSEYPPTVRSKKEHFPRRNRLISGAADAVLILRARLDSGSMHTANHAVAQGRMLFAVPGDPWNDRAAGCLRLLHSGAARICVEAADVLRGFGITRERQAAAPPPGRTLVELPITDAARRALDALHPGARTLEEVQEVSRLDTAELVSALAELELSGLAVQHPGRVYEKV